MMDEHDELLLDEPIADEPDDGEPEGDDIEIQIEGEDEPEETPLIKTLRQRERDLAKENAELRRKQAPESEIVIGDKPTLESCEYDEDRFDKEYDAYVGRKSAKAAQDRKREEDATSRNHSFERSVATYREQAAKLGVSGFQEAEDAVKAALSVEVQSAIPMYMKEPAKLVAALGKNPGRLAKIAAEPDPMRQIMMLRDMEGSIKVVNRRRPPEPEAETIQRGSAPVSVKNVDKERERLEAEALRTGKRDKIIAFNIANRKAAK